MKHLEIGVELKTDFGQTTELNLSNETITNLVDLIVDSITTEGMTVDVVRMNQKHPGQLIIPIRVKANKFAPWTLNYRFIINVVEDGDYFDC